MSIADGQTLIVPPGMAWQQREITGTGNEFCAELNPKLASGDTLVITYAGRARKNDS
jgi:hypothetical protein